MILACFGAFAILATALAAPIDDGSQNTVQSTTSVTDAQLDNSLQPVWNYFTSSSDDIHATYLNGPSPVIEIGHVNPPNIQTSPEPIRALNIEGSGEPNLNTGLPMTVPVAFDLVPEGDFFNEPERDSFECNSNRKMCSYCTVQSGCELYRVTCKKSDPNDCSLCSRPTACRQFTDDFKKLPLPLHSTFSACGSGQCNDV